MSFKKIASFTIALIMVFAMCACVDGGVEDAKDIKAKSYVPKLSYTEGELFEINDLSVYFENTSNDTVYTVNMGVVEGKRFSLLLVEGLANVIITAEKSGKKAELKFSLNVVAEQEEQEDKDYAALAAEAKTRAVSYAKTIKSLYWNSDNHTSKLTPGGGNPYLWPYTEQAAMVNSILEILDPVEDADDVEFFEQYLYETLEGLRYYRIKNVGLPYTNTAYGELGEDLDTYAMYNSGNNTSQKDNVNANKGGVYFDDNIWVAKEFYFAYKNTGEVKYLNEAINILNWIIGEGYETRVSAEGEFKNVAMNGIYWLWGVKDTINNDATDDSKTASLNSCASAPTAMVLLKVARELGTGEFEGAKYNALKASFEDKANKIVNFMVKVLRTDIGTYKDKIFLRTNDKGDVYLGMIDQQVLPYNTGCMLTAGVELYKTKNAPMVLTLTKETAAGSDIYFGNTVQMTGQYSYNNNSWFNSFLLDGFIDIAPYDENAETYVSHMASALDFAWKNYKASDGLIAPAWIIGWEAHPSTNIGDEGNGRQILLQAANAHCYAMLARYYESLV